MADRRRRRKSPSAESASSQRRRDRDPHYEYDSRPPPQYQPQSQSPPTQSIPYEADPKMRAEPREHDRLSSSEDSSSSNTTVDISRSPFKFGFKAFFTAPSERRRARKKRRSGLFKIVSNNSSSSEVNSDLAYGTGFIRRAKSKVRNRHGKEIDREERRRDERRSSKEFSRRSSQEFVRKEKPGSGPSITGRDPTNAELLALGANFRKLARESNQEDLKNARLGKAPEVGGFGVSRGLAPSRVSKKEESEDDEGWESASDDESEFSVDSRLAFGDDSSGGGGWFSFGKKKHTPLSRKNTIVDPKLFGPENSLNGIITKPVGFGEVSPWNSNSDFGQQPAYVPGPGGPTYIDQNIDQRAQADPRSNFNASEPPLEYVYPMPTSDPSRYDVARTSFSGPEPLVPSHRPDPVPIQQPQPFTPVSQSMYEPYFSPPRTESTSILKKTPSSSGRGKSIAEAALVGVAVTAGAAAFAAANREKRQERPREDEYAELEKERLRRRESERKEPREERRREKREGPKEKDPRDDQQSQHQSPDRDDRKENRREKDRRREDTDRDKKSSKRYDETRDERNERHERQREERRRERAEAGSESRRTKTDTAVAASAVNPFQYQIRDEYSQPSQAPTVPAYQPERRDDYSQPPRAPAVPSYQADPRHDYSQAPPVSNVQSYDSQRRSDYSQVSQAPSVTAYQSPRRSDYTEAPRASDILPPQPERRSDYSQPSQAPSVPAYQAERRSETVPNVYTVDREPDFSRRRSSSIKGQSSTSRPEPRDRTLHDAEHILEETEHSTAPIIAAATGAAIAAVAIEGYRESRSDKRREDRRNERRNGNDYDDQEYRSRKREPVKERDPVQEEADRAYREIVMARKIASQVIRQRSPSPDRSVVDKYEDPNEKEIIRIVTPPGMEPVKKQGPYDAPNADFRPDYVLEDPKQLRSFILPAIGRNHSGQGGLPMRDPDAEKPRPVLNVVRPTPVATPVPEKQIERKHRSRSSSRSKEQSEPKDRSERDEPKRSTSDDVVMGPKGNVVASPTASTASKGVTWGQNETKHFDVESPSDNRDEFVSNDDLKRSYDVPQEPKKSKDPKPSDAKKSMGWGALAGIIGMGAGAAVAASSESSKSPKSSKDEESKEKRQSQDERSVSYEETKKEKRPTQDESSVSYGYRGIFVEPESPYETIDNYRGVVVEAEPPQAKSSRNRSASQSKKQEEYRGVVVEPESPPRSKRQPSPPSPGPKPTSQPPGAFGDDLEFTATVAAGLQDTGFDPNIVIDNPSFRRRDSPPGSNAPINPIYQSPFVETVEDLTEIPAFEASSSTPPHGFVMAEVMKTPQDWRSVSPPAVEEEPPIKLSKKEQKKLDKAKKQAEEDPTPTPSTPAEEFVTPRETIDEPEAYFETPKLNKKEQKKREKAAAAQRLAEDSTPLSTPTTTPYSEPSVAAEIVAEPESYFDTPKKSKEKSKKGSSGVDDVAIESPRERTVTVPVDAFDDVKADEEDWGDLKKKKKNKRDSERFDSPSRSATLPESPSEFTRTPSKTSRHDSERHDSPSRSVIVDTPSSSKKSRTESERYDSPSRQAAPEIPSSSKKSTRETERFDSPSRAATMPQTASEVGRSSKLPRRKESDKYDSSSRSTGSFETASELDRSSSKSKSKSKERSRNDDVDPAEVALPPTTPSENSRNGDPDDSRPSRKSSMKDSGIFSSIDRGESRSVVSAGSRYDDDEPRRKKKHRSSTRDDDDTRSIASAPAGDEDPKKKKEKDKKTGFFSLFGSKSEVGGSRDESPKGSKDDYDEVKKKKKSKRHSTSDAASLYGDVASQSFGDLSRPVSNGNGNGNGHHDVDHNGEKKKSRSRSASTASKQDSFLGKTGTLGAGVGIVSLAVAMAAQQHSQPKADNASDNEGVEQSWLGDSEQSLARKEREPSIDPEIKERDFRPSIDPQYGDLLPLPPSEPASPNDDPTEDLPQLPDSGPTTPETDRVSRGRSSTLGRRNQETPARPKTPSQSAIPLKYILGNRSTPSSPGLMRSPPIQSPSTPDPEPVAFPRYRTRTERPTSWDTSKEYKPLFLVENNRRGSLQGFIEREGSLPARPGVHTRAHSAQVGFGDTSKYFGPKLSKGFPISDKPLAINTSLAPSKPVDDSPDSRGSTSQSEFKSMDDYELPKLPSQSTLGDVPSSPSQKETKSQGLGLASIAAATGLASALGYFTSRASPKTDDSLKNELPYEERPPSPFNPMTRNRSSSLFQSSPASRRSDVTETGSPSLLPRFAADSESLHSIHEDDGINMLASVPPSPVDVNFQKDRERALALLSGAATPETELPLDLEGTHILQDEDTTASIAVSEDSTVGKSKKSKGPSPASTQDDFSSVSESYKDAISDFSTPQFEDATQGSATPVLETSEAHVIPDLMDDGKGKGISPSFGQDNFSVLPEPTTDSFDSQIPIKESAEVQQAPEIPEQIAPMELELVDEPSASPPKKDKKTKEKRGSRSWTQQDLSALLAPFKDIIGPAPAPLGLPSEPSEVIETKTRSNSISLGQLQYAESKSVMESELEPLTPTNTQPAKEILSPSVSGPFGTAEEFQIVEPPVESLPETNPTVPERVPVQTPNLEVPESSSSKSKNDKKEKKNRKKSKSISAEAPELEREVTPENSSLQSPEFIPVPEPVFKPTILIPEEPTTAANLEIIAGAASSNLQQDENADREKPKSTLSLEAGPEIEGNVSKTLAAAVPTPSGDVTEEPPPTHGGEPQHDLSSPEPRKFQTPQQENVKATIEPEAVQVLTSSEAIEHPVLDSQLSHHVSTKFVDNWHEVKMSPVESELVLAADLEDIKNIPESSSLASPEIVEDAPQQQQDMRTDNDSTPKNMEPKDQPINDKSSQHPQIVDTTTTLTINNAQSETMADVSPDTPVEDDLKFPEPKKGKKKKKGKNSSNVEPVEEATSSQLKSVDFEPSLEPETPLETPAQEEPIVTSKKGKKKKGKSVPAWEPENEPTTPSEPVPEELPTPETEDVLKEEITPEASEVVQSKKSKKKKKGKSISVSEPEPEASSPLIVQESEGLPEVPTPSATRDENSQSWTEESVPAELVEEPVEISKDIEEPVPIPETEAPAISQEPEQEQESPMPTSKKSKKKGKKSQSSIEEDVPVKTMEEPAEAFKVADEPELVLPATPQEPGQEPEFSTPVSKKNKKKAKKGQSKAEEDTPVEPAPAPVDISRDLDITEPEHISSPMPQETKDIDDFTTPNSRKNNKGKKSESKIESGTPVDTLPETAESSQAPEIIEPEVVVPIVPEELAEPSPVPETTEPEIIEPIVSEQPVDDFPAPSSKKNKKKNKKSQSKTEEDLPVQSPSEPKESSETAVTPEPETISSAIPEPPLDADDFTTPSSKKSKKKNKKAQSIIEEEAQIETPLEPAQATEAEVVPVPEVVETPVEDVPEQSNASSSKKNKKKGKKAQQSEPEPVPETPVEVGDKSIPQDAGSGVQTPDIIEEIAAPTPKDNEGERRDQSWEPAPEPKQQVHVETAEASVISNVEDIPTLDVTEEVSTPKSKKGKKKNKKSKTLDLDNQHTEAMSTEDITPRESETVASTSEDQSYFPPAASILPLAAVAAAGAALVETESSKNEPSLIDDTISKLTSDEHAQIPPMEMETKPATPDGLAAGYKDEQLSLAKQLQEEFGSGSKKSKKDKKKRQSQPVTPERELSRSRATEVVGEEPSRARSLSIDPSTDRAAASPGAEARKSLYSEEQLELARQMKADFEANANKKSKKDKKSRLSRSVTRDELELDPPQEKSHTAETAIPQGVENADAWVPSPKGDGLDAGYQEEQLSLARQLQAEFGKKSKKGKKSRSTSRTPLDKGLSDDYFGEPSHNLTSEPSQVGDVQPEPTIETPSVVRDGLAAGYNEEQLELARQMKEDFDSKKTKKDKKGKKRQSLLLSNTEENIPSETATQNLEKDAVQTPIAEPVIEKLEIAPARPEDEFATVGKKSKKDKGKNGESSSLVIPDVPIPETVPVEEHTTISSTLIPETVNNSVIESASVIPVPEAEETGPVGKKSKKDKKSKKRESLVVAEPELDITPTVESKEPEQISALQVVERNLPEVPKEPEQIPAEHEVEQIVSEIPKEPEATTSLTTKKSKKDKKSKKRDSVVVTEPEPEVAGPSAPESQTTDEIPNAPISEGIVALEEIPKPEAETAQDVLEDDFAPASKKSKKAKKNKKRDSLVAAEPESVLSESAAVLEPKGEEQIREIPAEDRSLPEPEPVQPDQVEEFAAVTKKSKKDKKNKNRESVTETPTENDESTVMPSSVEQSQEVPVLGAVDTILPEATATPSESHIDETSTPTGKKSKKDKKSKNRGSIIETPIENGMPSEIPPIVEQSQDVPSQEITEQVVPETITPQLEDEVPATGKKSKKDKKNKRNSIMQDNSAESPPESSSRSSNKLEIVPIEALETSLPESPAPERAYDSLENIPLQAIDTKLPESPALEVLDNKLEEIPRDTLETTLPASPAPEPKDNQIDNIFYEAVGTPLPASPAVETEDTFFTPTDTPAPEPEEEFFTPSKKSKKDRKDKQRQTINQLADQEAGPTEILSPETGKDIPREALEVSLPASPAPEPEEGYFASTKKSKKDKKAKKRGSIAGDLEEEVISPGTVPSTAKADIPREALETSLPESPAIKPEDDNIGTTSKFSKKGKKQNSTQDTLEETSSSEPVPSLPENIQDLPVEAIETSLPESPSPELQETAEVDQKIPAEKVIEVPEIPQVEPPPTESSDNTSREVDVAPSAASPSTTSKDNQSESSPKPSAEEELAPIATSRKERKSKKRGSLLRNEIYNVHHDSEDTGSEVDFMPTPTGTRPSISESVSSDVVPQEAAASSSKEIEQGTDKPQSIAWSETFPEEPKDESDFSPDDESTVPAPESAREQFEHFDFSPKKSKKDKRQSLSRSSTADSLEPLSEEQDLPSNTEPREVPNETIDSPTIPSPAPEQNEESGFVSKKSKKGKKQQIVENLPIIEDTPTTAESSSARTQAAVQHENDDVAFELTDSSQGLIGRQKASFEGISPNESIQEIIPREEPTQEVEAFSFSPKKSKKDKKKKRNNVVPDFQDDSVLSTTLDPAQDELSLMEKPIDEPSLILDPISEKLLLPEQSFEPLQVSRIEVPETDEWDALPVKKSKKDRKKQKNSPMIETVEPASLSTSLDTITISKSEPVTTLLPAIDDNERSALSQEPIAPEPEYIEKSVPEQPIEEIAEEWSSSKKSKKDKKKRKELAKIDFSEPSESTTPLEFIPLSKSEPINTPLPAVDPEEEAILSQEHLLENPTIRGPESLKEIVPEQPTQEPVYDWAVSKEATKDKKSQTFDLPESSEVGPVPEPLEDKSTVVLPILLPQEITAENKELNLVREEPIINTAEEVETVNEPLDEWALPSKKKSKKDKRKQKSGISTPIEEPREIASEPSSVLEPPPPHANTSQEQNAKGLLLLEDSEPTIAKDVDIVGEPVEEWAPLPVKKSKKDKKKQKSISTPIEEPLASLQPVEEIPVENNLVEAIEVASPPQDADLQAETSEIPSSQDLTVSPDATSREILEEPIADEWSPLPTKKSKKDKKKRQSGISTPLQEDTIQDSEPISAPPLEQSPTAIEDRSRAPGAQEPLLGDHLTLANENIQEPDDTEWGPFATKNSKKDKKKGKSSPTPFTPEVSAPPVEEAFIAAPEESLPAQKPASEPLSNPEVDVLPLESSHIGTRDLSQEVDDSPATQIQEIIPEQFDDWNTSKKSKKDKKTRKSRTSPPLEETTAKTTNEIEETPVVIPEPQETNISRDIMGVEYAQPSNNHEVHSQEQVDEALELVTKRSKKEKKGKKSSREVSTSEHPSPSASVDRVASPEPQRMVTSPVPFEDVNNMVKNATSSSAPQTVPTESKDLEGITSSDMLRKVSKKDKRKRQATVDSNLDDGVTAQKPPITSWAEDVEEAEVERSLPVIEEIAKDESLAHIASTTESTPLDDFSRPTKKGKRGKKRNSISSSSNPDRSPVTKSNAQDNDSARDNNSIITAAVAGAAVATAVLLSKSTERQEEIESKNDVPTDPTTPTRKLSKEKREESIDKRSPREDVFDDPSLWEGAEPRVHNEENRGIDDGDEDRFWSPRQEDESVLHQPLRMEKPRPVEDVVPQVSSEAPYVEESRPLTPAIQVEQEDHSEGSPVHQEVEFLPGSPTLVSESQTGGDVEEEVEKQVGVDLWRTPSRVDQRSKEQGGMEEGLPAVLVEGRDFARPSSQGSSSGVSRNLFQTPPPNRGSLFEQNSPIVQEHISEPAQELPIANERGVAFQDVPIARTQPPYYSGSKFAHSGFSDLPIVDEESPAQLEAEKRFLTPHSEDIDFSRDSAFITDSPTPPQKGFSDDHEHVRDSGVHLGEGSPSRKARTPVSSTDDAIARLAWPAVNEETETVNLQRSQRPSSKVVSPVQHEAKQSKEPRISPKAPEQQTTRRSFSDRPVEDHHKSPSQVSTRPRGDSATDFYRSQRSVGVEPTKLRRSSDDRHALPSQSPPEQKHEKLPGLHRTSTIRGLRRTRTDSVGLASQSADEKLDDLLRTQALRGRNSQGDSLVRQRLQRSEPTDFQRSTKPKEDRYSELTSTRHPLAQQPKGFSELEAGAAMAGASLLGFAAARKLSHEARPETPERQRGGSNPSRLHTPDLNRPNSVTSNRSSGTPPLRRSDRKFTGDLRSLSQQKPTGADLAKEAELAAITATSASAAVSHANPTANEGRVRAKDMADVYDGFGEGRMGSPRSPTRPHSMRRRQSMQVLDLEAKVEQLATENRLLAEFKAQAERQLHTSQRSSSNLVEKDAEIDALKRTLEYLQKEVTRLTEVNDGLSSANATIARQHSDRYNLLETQHAQATRELAEVRDAHGNLSAGMEGIIRNEVQTAVQEKDREIAQLHADLDLAKQQIKEMQRQILASKVNEIDFLTVRDEDHFDNACQQLCQHVQQWVLRFSKFSDMRACRLTSEINNDKTIDRLDNAILDGSDVDNYLADRVKRRDVFMSMTMTMVWEFVFTRYLFGMDREQRQKLKSLEKTLTDVGPAAAVHQWRATTLTLLSKRQAFAQQREQDTKAVVHAILETLSEILPPPTHLEKQIEDQLTRVMKAAVDLSIEMRTQRAEYMMLPPLQPEYDANGDLASKVTFNAALMNERSGDTASNEELEAQKAVVRIVLFPLVVKKGNDRGEGDEEIVVCPAQVLVAKPKKQVRVFTPNSMAGSKSGNNSRTSMQSSMPDNMV